MVGGNGRNVRTLWLWDFAGVRRGSGNGVVTVTGAAPVRVVDGDNVAAGEEVVEHWECEIVGVGGGGAGCDDG